MQVNDQYFSQNPAIDYLWDNNSNSYVTTLLNIVGIDVLEYEAAVTPPNVVSSAGGSGSGMPGIGVDVLVNPADPSYAIDLTLEGTNDGDIIQTGAGKDVVWGGIGRDTISTGSQDDQLSGDTVHYDNSMVAGFWIEDDGVGDIFRGGTGYDLYGVYGTSQSPIIWDYTNGTAVIDQSVLSKLDRIEDEDGLGEIWTDRARWMEESGDPGPMDSIVFGKGNKSFSEFKKLEDGSIYYSQNTADGQLYSGNFAVVAFQEDGKTSLLVSEGSYDPMAAFIIQDFKPGDFGIFLV